MLAATERTSLTSNITYPMPQPLPLPPTPRPLTRVNQIDQIAEKNNQRTLCASNSSGQYESISGCVFNSDTFASGKNDTLAGRNFACLNSTNVDKSLNSMYWQPPAPPASVELQNDNRLNKKPSINLSRHQISRTREYYNVFLQIFTTKFRKMPFTI